MRFNVGDRVIYNDNYTKDYLGTVVAGTIDLNGVPRPYLVQWDSWKKGMLWGPSNSQLQCVHLVSSTTTSLSTCTTSNLQRTEKA